MLQLRILPGKVLPRDFDAKEIDIDLEADHRPDELLILLPGRFVDSQPGLLHVVPELGDHRVGDLEILGQLAEPAQTGSR